MCMTNIIVQWVHGNCTDSFLSTKVVVSRILTSYMSPVYSKWALVTISIHWMSWEHCPSAHHSPPVHNKPWVLLNQYWTAHCWAHILQVSYGTVRNEIYNLAAALHPVSKPTWYFPHTALNHSFAHSLLWIVTQRKEGHAVSYTQDMMTALHTHSLTHPPTHSL